MKKISVIALLAAACMVFASCAGVLTFRNPDISGGKLVEKKGDKGGKPPVKFEDFETGALIGGYGYANTAGGASVKYVISDGTSKEPAEEGTYCAKAIYDTGTSSEWGCGFGAQSAYGGGFIDGTGREYLDIWVKAPEGTTFYFFCNEASANGADGEYWNSPDQTAAGKWMEYVVPFDEFFKNIYSGNQTGNNQLDPSGIGTVGAQLGGAQGKGELFIDNIWFK